MLYNEDKYYLLGYSEHHEKGGKILTYRVDRMKLPKILDAPIVPRPEEFDPVDYTVDVFSMFDGKPCKVRLRCENRLMNYVFDRFGEDVQTSIVSKERFDAVVDVSVSQTFFAWVFQFAGAMQIVSPKAVKEQYSEMLDKAREQVK